jgi:hypothetical protein
MNNIGLRRLSFKNLSLVLFAAFMMGGILFMMPAAHAAPVELYSSPLDRDHTGLIPNTTDKHIRNLLIR